jgi:uncharacterized protein (TIGR00290 family)
MLLRNDVWIVFIKYAEKDSLIKKKVLISWSTGKDSAYALHHIRQTNQYEVVGLLSTITEEYDRVAMHATRHELLKKQAERLGLPLYPVFIPSSCSNEIYEARMEIVLGHVIKEGITHIVFGDLFLDDIRKYRESKLAKANIIPLFPLWGIDTVHLAKEMINAGIKAVITCIDPKKLDASFVGRQFDIQLLSDFPKGIDPCGENGEFHTFVYDGPMFYNPIPISIGTVVERNGYIFRDVMYLNGAS